MTSGASDNTGKHRDIYEEQNVVPEEPFGIAVAYWKAALILFTFVLMAWTLILLLGGSTPHAIGALYAIPAILFAYFYRRKGVLIVYLLAMYFFGIVVLFRYPNTDDIFAAALRAILLIAIAFIVSYLTHYLILEKRKYHAIFDNTENGVIVVNIRDHTLTEMNQRFIHLAGYKSPQGDRITFESFLVDPAHVTGIFSALQTACSAPAVETTLRREDGSTWAAVIVGRKISADEAVLTFIDITERRRLDEALRQCNADSNLYLDILTHDINNMNTASLSYGRMLANRSGISRDALADKLVTSLEKTDETIRNVSVLRKLTMEDARIVPVSLGNIIRREMAAYPDARIEFDGADVMILADDMLSSVFTNLIGNSMKYGGKGSPIIIRVTPRETDVEVSVEDNGGGIPDTVKPIIFERFRRGDTTVSGKGLGLFICRSLITRYGGEIRVGDRVPGDSGRGTVFTFTLKRA